jgi:hypothetical protein
MSRSTTLVLAGYVLALVVIIAATVLTALHDASPTWFEPLAIFAAGGSTGALLPVPTPGAAPAGTLPTASSAGAAPGPIIGG